MQKQPKLNADKNRNKKNSHPNPMPTVLYLIGPIKNINKIPTQIKLLSSSKDGLLNIKYKIIDKEKVK